MGSLIVLLVGVMFGFSAVVCWIMALRRVKPGENILAKKDFWSGSVIRTKFQPGGFRLFRTGGVFAALTGICLLVYYWADRLF